MNDPNRRYDGFSAIRRGVNTGLAPRSLASDQLSWAVNATMRGTSPHNRPGIKKRALAFDLEDNQATFEGGRFQGAGVYLWRGIGSEDIAILLASIGGRIYEVDVQKFTVNDITPVNDANPSILPQAWVCQAEMFGIIQDGQSQPLIYNAGSVRRAKVGEVPCGTITHYAQGRIGTVLPDGRSFTFGNIVGSTEGGTPAFNFRDSVLSFTENNFLNGGGAFSCPQRITAMRSIATVDSTLSDGPTQIFTADGAYAANLPYDRATWFDLRYPLTTVSLQSHGALAQNSTVNINNDIWFRGSDGIRSLQIARRDFGSWGDTPMSQEMDRLLRDDTPSLLKFGSAVLFDNRLLMTVAPYVAHRGVWHRGLVALDFFESSSLARNGIPAYDCLWTGLKILQILTVAVNDVPRCFIFALDSESKISLYELSKSEPHDNYGLDTQQRIPWVLETPAYTFGEESSVAYKQLKRIETGDMWVSNIIGKVNFNVRFRSDNYPVWTDWHDWSECAQQECVPLWCDAPNQPQYRPRMMLPVPTDDFETQTGKQKRQGWQFQARIEVTGPAQLDCFRLVALNQPEAKYEAPRGEGTCVPLTACNLAMFDYSIE